MAKGWREPGDKAYNGGGKQAAAYGGDENSGSHGGIFSLSFVSRRHRKLAGERRAAKAAYGGSQQPAATSKTASAAAMASSAADQRAPARFMASVCWQIIGSAAAKNKRDVKRLLANIASMLARKIVSACRTKFDNGVMNGVWRQRKKCRRKSVKNEMKSGERKPK